ncbi:class I SAM-dependent methyltransferase [Chloroflexi bacterium TSY]|nr:class I SAM-dependent methyltransferase [Chloroflexi bacterium TSY]
MTGREEDSTQRFSNRVENYVKYRPRYPQAIVDFLRTELDLMPNAHIADIGSGTGFLSQLFLDSGYRVYGIEPNKEMRQAGESLLEQYQGFTSVGGTAEATTLDDSSIDMIVAGQAFHWFDPVPTRQEFVRILNPQGYVALVWNSRWLERSELMERYEELVHAYAANYGGVSERNFHDDIITNFFAPNQVTKQSFENQQHLEWTGLKGRLLSSSYSPTTGQPGYDEMIDGLRTLFDQHQQDGQVTIYYRTRLYCGQLMDGL